MSVVLLFLYKLAIQQSHIFGQKKSLSACFYVLKSGPERWVTITPKILLNYIMTAPPLCSPSPACFNSNKTCTDYSQREKDWRVIYWIHFWLHRKKNWSYVSTAEAAMVTFGRTKAFAVFCHIFNETSEKNCCCWALLLLLHVIHLSSGCCGYGGIA